MGLAKISPSSLKASAIAAAHTSARVMPAPPRTLPRRLVGRLVAREEPGAERRQSSSLPDAAAAYARWNRSSRS